MIYEEFEEQLRRYEEATVELVNLAPPASALGQQAIDNLRQCQRLRLQLRGQSFESLEGRARRLSDLYPTAQIDRHHVGLDRRTAKI